MTEVPQIPEVPENPVRGEAEFSIKASALTSYFAPWRTAANSVMNWINGRVSDIALATAGALSASSEAVAARDSIVDEATNFYDSKSDAVAAISSLTDGQNVEIFSDESRGNRRTRYLLRSGSLVYKYTIQNNSKWYVDSVSGDDSNDGLSSSSAKRTLGSLVLLSDGDAVYLSSDSVFREEPDFGSLSGCHFRTMNGGKRAVLSAWEECAGFTVHGSGPAYTFDIDLPLATYARNYPARLGSNVFQDIVFEMGFSHNGLSGDGKPLLINTTQVGIARHGSLHAEMTFRDNEIVGTNSLYSGGFYHCNPSPSETAKATIVEGSTIIGSLRNGLPTGTAFFTHGDGSGTVQKDGWIIKDVECDNVNNCFVPAETGYLHVLDSSFRNFKAILATGPVTEFSFSNCEFYMTQKFEGTIRPLQIPDGCKGTIIDSYFDIFDTDFLAQSSGSVSGDLDVIGSTIVLNNPFKNGSLYSFFRSEGSGSDGLGDISITDTILYTRGFPDCYIVNTPTLGSLKVRDVLIIGPMTKNFEVQRDPLCRVGGVEVPLSTLDPDARVVVVDAARCLAIDEPNSPIKTKAGTWRPNDPIVSGAAYSYGAATQPRTHVFVGDKIWRSNGAAPFSTFSIVDPDVHMNGVHFCNSAQKAFLMVGDAGTIYRSNTYVTAATLQTSGSTENLRAVWGNSDGVVVAVGDNGEILRSPDSGVTWTVVVSLTTENLRGISSNGTGWVAVGDNGAVGNSSDNGLTWTWGTQSSLDIYAVLWNEEISKYLIGGDSGLIRTSTNGTSWSSRDTDTKQRISCFAETPEGVVAGVYQTEAGFTGSFLLSDDGISWEWGSEILPFDVRSISSVVGSVYQQKGIVAVGESASIAMMRSPNDREPARIQKVFGKETKPTELRSVALAAKSIR